MSERAFVALGSNLGDRLTNLRRAVTLLSERPGVRVLGSSRVYETDPVGPPQPDYLNAVIELDTDLSAHELLHALLDVERELGRVREERWGPRVIDLDLLSVDRQVVGDEALTLPHPRMHERGFVLVPLLELDPDPMLPGGRSIGELRPGAGFTAGGVRVFAPPLV
jgi:2-amino-4-hydroxy-6-hydroxymethyldihydropteridine diphosphokinase